MKRVRGGAGLGDSVYVRAIVERLLAAGDKVEVCTHYPEVFADLPVSVKPFDRFNIQVLAHYTAGKLVKTTNQWEDICISAKIEPFTLKISWTVRNKKLVADLLAEAAGRPLVIVGAPHAPMARNDGFGKELLPEKMAFDSVLSGLDGCFTVKIGKAEQPYQISANKDLSGVTSVTDLLDLGLSCDALVGQCSFVIPIAEAFDKPLMTVWAAAGMSPALHYYVSAITPTKVLSKATSWFVRDDWSAEQIEEVIHSFSHYFAKERACAS